MCGDRTAEKVKDSEFMKEKKAVATAGGKFVDDKFKANSDSLIADWESQNPEIQELVEEWTKIQWISATEIKVLNDEEGKLQVFSGSIEPSDIKQGALGDCYLLSVMSVLTEYPDRIKKLFLT